MKKALTSLSIVLCTALVQWIPAPEAPPSSPFAVDLLETGVRLLKTCGYTMLDRHSFDGEGNEIDLKDAEDKFKIAEKLSLPLLLRSGRFHLNKPIPPNENPLGRVILLFAPHPEHERLRPRETDDKNLEKVLNSLSGHVYIDPDRQNITEIKGNLANEVSFRIWHNIIPITVRKIDFTYSERYEPGYGWLPETLMATLVYQKPALTERGRETHDEYKLGYTCKK